MSLDIHIWETSVRMAWATHTLEKVQRRAVRPLMGRIVPIDIQIHCQTVGPSRLQ